MNYKKTVKAAVCAVIIAISFFAFGASFSLAGHVQGYAVSEDGRSAVKIVNRILLFNDNGEMTMPLNIDADGEGYEIFQSGGFDLHKFHLKKLAIKKTEIFQNHKISAFCRLFFYSAFNISFS